MTTRIPGLLCAAALLVAPPLFAQALNAPHASYVYPAGGRQASTVQVRVGGRSLDGVSTVVVSGAGVRAQVAALDKPLTQRQISDLRDRVAELQKTAKTPAERREIADMRMMIGESVRRNANPMLAEIATLSVTIDADAEPGPRELRLGTPVGLTNPITFVVGQLPEVSEKDEKLQPADTELTVALPATVNGRLIPGDGDRAQFPLRQAPQYMPGDVDRYRFTARAAQDLVCVVAARDLMPYLADAVPGWIQPTLTLYDAAGRQVAYDDDYRFQPDPVLHVRIPADGEYVLEIKDALYRGREDFVYRISIGELPFITGIFPLGGPVGAKTVVQLNGWNLPATRVTMDTTGATPGLYPVTPPRGANGANRVPFAVDTLPEVTEREPNDTVKTAQRITTPTTVNGRIQEPGDVDVFAFQGRAGAEIVAEVLARRLGSPLDSSLELLDGQGRRVAFNDDWDDKASGLLTHQADSHIAATLPADGPYFLRIGDVQHNGGGDFGYRLRVSAPRPDFELRVSPAETGGGAGTCVPVTVTAIRRDGFTGDIVLNLKDGPRGLTLSGGVLPAGQDQVRITLGLPTTSSTESLPIVITGRGMVQGKSVEHRAVAAEDMMQAFAYHHLVPADSLRVSAVARGARKVPVRVVTVQPVRIGPAAAARVRIAFPVPRAFDKLAFELDSPPDGVSIGEATFSQNGAEFELLVDPAKAKAGLRGNLIVTVSGERVPQPNQPEPPAAARRRLPLATLPAIAFEITK